MISLKSELEKLYHCNVEIRKVLTLRNVLQLTKKTINNNIIILVEKTKKNRRVFEYNNNNSNDILLLKSGKAMGGNISNIHPKTVFKIIDNIETCPICDTPPKNKATRSCFRCGEQFCVACQIKMMITCTADSIEYMATHPDIDINCLSCPFCRYEHEIYIPSLQVFIDSMLKRIRDEACIRNLDEDDIIEIDSLITSKWNLFE